MYKTLTIHTRSTYWTNREVNIEELIVDADDLAHEIEKVTNELLIDNFEIVCITPINSGTVANGNGYYQTESVILLARKIKQ
jgi:hypothetical protein